MLHVQHVASSFWLLCIWHKPQRVTKQQKPYYFSTFHCLLLAITSSAHSVGLVRYWHQPQKRLATFYTHTCTLTHTHTPTHHSFYFLSLSFFLFTNEKADTQMIASTGHSWALLMLAKGHICFLRTLKQRAGGTRLILRLCKCVHMSLVHVHRIIHVFYSIKCVLFTFQQHTFFSKIKTK